jgi:hypothetical protein
VRSDEPVLPANEAVDILDLAVQTAASVLEAYGHGSVSDRHAVAAELRE